MLVLPLALSNLNFLLSEYQLEGKVFRGTRRSEHDLFRGILLKRKAPFSRTSVFVDDEAADHISSDW